MNNSFYPTDLTDEQWEYLRPFIPPPKTGGRPRTVGMRAVMNAILYFLRSGCQWRMLPKHFPPWGTVWSYFRKWRIDGTWQKIQAQLYRKMRANENRAPTSTGAIIDSQSVKTTEQGGERGYDAGKKVNGRKRHLIVDTLGLLLEVSVHSASIQDRDGAKGVIEKLFTEFSSVKRIWGDRGYSGSVLGEAVCGLCACDCFSSTGRGRVRCCASSVGCRTYICVVRSFPPSEQRL